MPALAQANILHLGLGLAGLALAAGLAWGLLRRQVRRQQSLVDRINRVLPQTQCGQCGFAGCLPYARALAQGEAVNKCPPGGSEVIVLLAAMLNEPVTALDPACGATPPPRRAVIREAECIGCTKCITACPVDAIIGAPKLMHSVIADECTGCDLCLAPCPVDCIDLVELPPEAVLEWQLPSRIGGRATQLGAVEGARP